ncbi:MAG: hypothetical protein HW399_180 [Dehalococcoidia bacterium]|nr:hypothetical protein [Dehalococcoidia bacterium]
MTSVETMVREGKIHPFQATRGEIVRVMTIAKRDLAEAERIQCETLDWSFAIAYNAVLQTCRAYMFNMGYRAASSEAHKTAFEFMRVTVDEPLRQTIGYFDRTRIKRHRVIYDEPGLVTEKETQQLISKAKLFLEYIERELEKKGGKLP